eukprot:TRINITY_DN662359_c0_g2_i1.p1 TRINITY_DN662359_c0_g2~~TRINITY_DN662359_c0_g2_i1.p1  ORF type:complete len:262 (-),score=37.55 TRINITY_DN662359_c0_g2_i1:189-974(-)
MDSEEVFAVVSLSTIIVISICALVRKLPSRSESMDEENPRVVEEEHQHETETEINETDTPSAPRFHHNGRDCAICLSDVTLPIETNCGHIFCVSCFIEYWNISFNGLAKATCPYCRRNVNMIQELFSPEDHSEAFNLVCRYNNRFSGNISPTEFIRDIPLLSRGLWRWFIRSDTTIPLVFQIRCVVGWLFLIGYLLAPLDLIPESIYGLWGYIDDILVGLMIFAIIIRVYRSFLADRYMGHDTSDDDEQEENEQSAPGDSS